MRPTARRVAWTFAGSGSAWNVGVRPYAAQPWPTSGSSGSTGTLQSTSCSKSQSAECALAKSALMPGWPVLWRFRRSRVRIGSSLA